MTQFNTLSRAARAAGATEKEIDDAIERENDLTTECDAVHEIFAAECKWPLTIDAVERRSFNDGWEIRYRSLAPTGEDTTHECTLVQSSLSPKAVVAAVAKDWMRRCERRRDEYIASAIRNTHIAHPFHVFMENVR